MLKNAQMARERLRRKKIALGQDQQEIVNL